MSAKWKVKKKNNQVRELYNGGGGAGRAGIKFPWDDTFGCGGGGLWGGRKTVNRMFQPYEIMLPSLQAQHNTILDITDNS